MSTLASVFGRGVVASRPAAGIAGQQYFATDVGGGTLQRDNGSSWDSIAGALLSPGVSTKVANYTVLAADNNTTFVANAPSLVFTLPAPATAGAGFWIIVKNNNQTATGVKTNTSGVLIDGVDCSSVAATTGLTTGYGAVKYQTDGTNWYTIAMDSVGGSSSAMTQIQKITNGSTSAMTFSAIPGTYSALLLVLQARAASAAGVAYQLMQFNGDSGANYAYNFIFRASSATSGGEASAVTSMRCAYLPDTAGTANFAGAAHIWIPNYAGTSFFKNMLSNAHGSPDGTAIDFGVFEFGGQWGSTAAITSITLVNTMLVNSVAVLYGLS